MAHFAKIEDGIVTSTVETDIETLEAGLLGNPSLFVDYTNSKRPAVFGGTYREDIDEFIDPSPYSSWVLDFNNDWQAPQDMPNDGKNYYWSEEELIWIEKVSPV